MLAVTVVGGYLGAGKTTLVNHLLRNARGVRIAVLVNEFGALPIDADLIEAQDDALISIAGGCVCCSYGNDLVQAMLDLAKLDSMPDHVLIEASGVALPGAIAASVGLLDGFAIDGIVVLADAETIRAKAADDYVGDTVERQLSDADLIVLNKADLIAEAQVEDLHRWMLVKAPEASVVAARHAQVPNGVIMQSFAPRTLGLDLSRSAHGGAFESAVLQFDKPCNAQEIAQTLASAALNLVRAKGFVPTREGLRAVQVVGRRWAVSDAPLGATPGIVAIANFADKRDQTIHDRMRSHGFSLD